MIDVGGPSMLRGAAKNFAHVAAVCRPERYGFVLDELREHGELSLETRRRARGRGVRHDRRLRGGDRELVLRARAVPGHARRSRSTRCSTSPTARTRTSAPRTTPSAARARTCSRASSSCTARSSRSTTSTTSSAARALAREFALPACVIVKHANPCGVAVGATIEEAYDKALASDPVSAYGGIVVLNRDVDAAARREARRAVRRGALRAGLRRRRARGTAAKAGGRASSSTASAARRRREQRELQARARRHARAGRRLARSRTATAGQLVAGTPDEAQWGDLVFAWRVCKHVASNAIVIAKDLRRSGSAPAR